MKYSYIAIDGLIGTGKTNLTKLLAKALNAASIFEEYANNPFLEQFYSNPQQFALPTQLFFLLSRYQQLANISQTDLFQTCYISDFTIAKNTIFASVTLNDEELSLYYRIQNLTKKEIPFPDLIIFLQAEMPLLLDRIHKRGFTYEKGITGQYLKLLNDAYNQYFFHVTEAPVVVINVTDLEFSENSKDLSLLVKELKKPHHGLQYINPKQG